MSRDQHPRRTNPLKEFRPIVGRGGWRAFRLEVYHVDHGLVACPLCGLLYNVFLLYLTLLLRCFLGHLCSTHRLLRTSTMKVLLLCCFIMCGAYTTAVVDKGKVCMLMLCYLFFHLFLLAFPRLRHAPSQAVDEVGLLHEPGQHGGGNAMPAQLAHCGGGAPFDAAQTV